MVGTESLSSEKNASTSNNSKIKEKINLFEEISKKKNEKKEKNASLKGEIFKEEKQQKKDNQDYLNLELNLNFLKFSEGILRPAWGMPGVGLMRNYKANQGSSPATKKQPPTSKLNSAKKRIKPGNFKSVKELFQAQLKQQPHQLPPTLIPNPPKNTHASTTPSTHHLPPQHSKTSLGIKVYSDQMISDIRMRHEQQIVYLQFTKRQFQKLKMKD